MFKRPLGWNVTRHKSCPKFKNVYKVNDLINLKVKKYAIYPCRYCTKPKSDLKCNETRLSYESIYIYMEINYTQ